MHKDITEKGKLYRVIYVPMGPESPTGPGAMIYEGAGTKKIDFYRALPGEDDPERILEKGIELARDHAGRCM